MHASTAGWRTTISQEINRNRSLINGTRLVQGAVVLTYLLIP
jgi:hypothetical protein